MGIDYFTVDGVTVIRVRGSLDHVSADALREGVYAVLRRRQRTVFVNLDHVPGIDAAGLGVLAHVHRMAAIVGAAVTLTNVRPRVRDMLDIVGLSACFQIAASESDAVEDFELCGPALSQERLRSQREKRDGGDQGNDHGEDVQRLMSIDAPDGIDHGRPSQMSYRRGRDFTPIHRPVQVNIW
jgi:anti-anti-sigma factor